LIVPLSVFATERMRPIQSLLNKGKELLVLSHFDVYPSKLFEGAKQRLTIIIRSNREAPNFVTSSYQRWFGPFRDQLFQTLSFWPAHYFPSSGSLEKISGETHSSALNKLRSFPLGSIRESRVSPGFYVHRIPYNYVKALNFVPYFWNETAGEKKSEDYKPYAAVVSALNDAAISVLNSNLFFMWWHSSFEGYHCGKHEITSFPFGANKLSPECANELKQLSRSLMLDLERNKNRKEASYKKTGKVIYDEFFPRKSKTTIDKIDLALQKHFGLSDDELDFVINYDIKYRIGGDGDGDDE